MGDQFSFKISRQIVPCKSTFGSTLTWSVRLRWRRGRVRTVAARFEFHCWRSERVGRRERERDGVGLSCVGCSLCNG